MEFAAEVPRTPSRAVELAPVLRGRPLGPRPGPPCGSRPGSPLLS